MALVVVLVLVLMSLSLLLFVSRWRYFCGTCFEACSVCFSVSVSVIAVRLANFFGCLRSSRVLLCSFPCDVLSPPLLPRTIPLNNIYALSRNTVFLLHELILHSWWRRAQPLLQYLHFRVKQKAWSQIAMFLDFTTTTPSRALYTLFYPARAAGLMLQPTLQGGATPTALAPRDPPRHPSPLSLPRLRRERTPLPLRDTAMNRGHSQEALFSPGSGAPWNVLSGPRRQL